MLLFWGILSFVFGVFFVILCIKDYYKYKQQGLLEGTTNGSDIFGGICGGVLFIIFGIIEILNYFGLR